MWYKAVLWKNSKSLTINYLLFFRLVVFDVKIYILQDHRYKVEVKEVFLYLLPIEVW